MPSDLELYTEGNRNVEAGIVARSGDENLTQGSVTVAEVRVAP